MRKAIGEALNARNVAFLVGAGCPSLYVDGSERAICTMEPFAKTFCSYPNIKFDDDRNVIEPPKCALVADDVTFLANLGMELEGIEYAAPVSTTVQS